MIWHVVKDKATRDRILNTLLNALHTKATKYAGKLVVFNWKMNPETLESAIDMARKSDHKNIVVAPPFVFIEEIGKIIKTAKLGAQDLFYKNTNGGSFTGEISASELVNLGVKYAIIGHSERRAMGESDEIISKKIKTALDNGLIPILCVGESKKESGSMNNELSVSSKEFVRDQLEKDLFLIRNSSFSIHNSLIVAYEPIWAIGTGNNCSPEVALEMIKFIKSLSGSLAPALAKSEVGVPTAERVGIVGCRLLVLYGGSVNSKNISDFLKYKEIDGVLVGGASLDPKLFF
ncbi:MAG: triose-phosphate isomerase [bacterium]|nr:triose-phosphate isomerase [bacterium]